jgi:hypothetical protein
MLPNAFQEFASSLIGLSLSHIWIGYGSALFLEFGELAARHKSDGSPTAPHGEMSLMIEWSWRIEAQHAIICGSWSDETLWLETLPALLGREVSHVELFGRLPEIDIGLSNGFHVLSFMTAEGLPAWTLFDRRHPRERWLSVEEDGLSIAESS